MTFVAGICKSQALGKSFAYLNQTLADLEDIDALQFLDKI